MEFNVVLDFFKTYGWQLGLLSLSGIIVLGCLKWFGCFKKVNDKYKKYLYFGLSVAFSIIACTIYILATHSFNWVSYLLLCVAVIGVTLVAYGIYENTGLRALWVKVVLNNVSKFFKTLVSAIVKGSMNADKLKKMAIDLGSETLNELANQAKALEEEKAKVEQTEQSAVQQ